MKVNAENTQDAASTIVLKNFFVVCTCGYELRFDTIDQVRICGCGRTNVIGNFVKQYLIGTYTEQEAKIEHKHR